MKSVVLLSGNSDNKLTQKEWAEFCTQIKLAVEHHSIEIYFMGATNSIEQYQSACWAFSTKEPNELKLIIKMIREEYKQDSVSWLECEPEFI